MAIFHCFSNLYLYFTHSLTLVTVAVSAVKVVIVVLPVMMRIPIIAVTVATSPIIIVASASVLRKKRFSSVTFGSFLFLWVDSSLPCHIWTCRSIGHETYLYPDWKNHYFDDYNHVFERFEKDSNL
jgi:hypothetical protein